MDENKDVCLTENTVLKRKLNSMQFTSQKYAVNEIDEVKQLMIVQTVGQFLCTWEDEANVYLQQNSS